MACTVNNWPEDRAGFLDFQMALKQFNTDLSSFKKSLRQQFKSRNRHSFD